MELLFAFAMFYLAFLVARWFLRKIVGALRLVIWLLLMPLLLLARRRDRRQAVHVQRLEQRAATMARLRELAD